MSDTDSVVYQHLMVSERVPLRGTLIVDGYPLGHHLQSRAPFPTPMRSKALLDMRTKRVERTVDLTYLLRSEKFSPAASQKPLHVECLGVGQ